MAIMQYDMQLERSVYEILQILGISLTDKTNIRDLFDKKNINDVKVLYGASEPNFSFCCANVVQKWQKKIAIN